MAQSVSKSEVAGASLSREAVHVDWAEIEKLSLALGAALLQKGLPCRRLVAVSRGGLIPATLIAHILHVDIVDTICVKSYFGGLRKQARLLKTTKTGGGKHTIVVDDIVDSGETIKLIKKKLPHAHYAVLFSKIDGVADTVVKQVPPDVWIKLAYEQN